MRGIGAARCTRIGRKQKTIKLLQIGTVIFDGSDLKTASIQQANFGGMHTKCHPDCEPSSLVINSGAELTAKSGSPLGLHMIDDRSERRLPKSTMAVAVDTVAKK